MTAWDQPTTEPRFLTGKPAEWDEESLSDDDLVSRAFDLGIKYAESLDPAPQPAADTEVQWGVRLTGRDEADTYVRDYDDEQAARDAHSLNQRYFEDGDEAWSTLWALSTVVRYRRTPWEEA